MKRRWTDLSQFLILNMVFIIFLTHFYSCIPTASNTARRTNLKTASQNSTDDGQTPINENDDKIYWATTTKVGINLNIYYKTPSVAFLKGKDLSIYLGNPTDNMNKVYCLAVDLNLGSASQIRQLRVRAVPESEKDPILNIQVKKLRVDFDDEEGNKKFCSGAIPHVEGGLISNSINITYTTTPLYLGTNFIISSKNLSLYLSNGSITSSSQISTSLVTAQTLSLKISPSDPLAPSGVCSNSTCSAQGYDCCLEDQCVTNGVIRPNASNETDYLQAINDVTNNPANMVDYPHIYFVCPGFNPPNPTDSTSDSTLENQKFLLYLKELYFCLSYSDDDPADLSYCRPNLEKAKESVWDMCGCATIGELPPDDPENSCPRYGLKAFDKNSEVITDPTPAMGFTEEAKLNYNGQSDIFIRGENIHSYLSTNENYKKSYCLTSFFTSSGSAPQLRMMATPYAFRSNDNQDVWGFKINSQNKNSNLINCQGTVAGRNDLVNVVYEAKAVCTQCTSQSLNFYQSSTGISDATSLSSSINISNLTLTLKDSDGIMITSSNNNASWFISNIDPIARINCLPQPNDQATPFQQEASVSGRTAPQRFFLSTTGQEYFDLKKVTGISETLTTSASEGKPFYYVDQQRKIGPIMGDFNMNSILGQMRVDLSAALPATKLDIEFDEVYTISTVQGEYTPCPSCAKDSWYNGFTPFPASRYGTGAQAINYTTVRDEWNYNLSNGNYEDTLFARACWVPPTMIPFSHQKMSDLQTQRQTRQKIQSAFFANGYRRDWYGFNQGALIGSFNGVNWFAIGKQRRVRSTSKKLFLAINAPYADLANPASYKVHIIQDSGEVAQPEVDYDPELKGVSSPLQNEAGSCQRYHYCETDAECISNLGWEYMCSYVNSYRTISPVFDIEGNEVVNQEKTVSYAGMITGEWVDSGKKRCTYRGAGAPCIQDYSNLTSPHLRKMFTCAPNFYCASVTDSVFNSQIKREPNNLSSILFGQDSNVMGRPLKYVNATSSLSEDIQTGIQKNAAAQIEDFSHEVGICRPGKNITSYISGDPDPLLGHSQGDSQGRTDYISQISSCRSDAITKGTDLNAGHTLAMKRVWSCPVLNDEGNYIYTIPKTDNETAYTMKEQKNLVAQNSCGNESIDQNEDPVFKNIEAEPLASLVALTQKKITKDSCLRRAGSVCHSSLDCVPNKLHSEQANFIINSGSFGGTEAEHNFWKEYLTCGTVSNPYRIGIDTESDSTASDLPMGRCCRPSNLKFTMYTEGDPSTQSKNPNLDTSEEGLSIKDPKALGRYSRYTIIEGLSSSEPTSDIYPTQPKVQYSASTPPVVGEQRPLKYQWKTFNDTGSKTCCSGWIRSFADGSHNWAVPNRLHFDVSNFKCLNFRTPFGSGETSPLNLPPESNAFEDERSTLCSVPGEGGCSHYMGEDGQGFSQSRSTIVYPKEIFNSNTDKIFPSGGSYISFVHSAERKNYLFDLAPYVPKLATELYTHPIFTDPTNNPDYIFLTNNGDLSMMRGGERRMILKIPAYVDGIENLLYGGNNFKLSRRKSNPGNDTFEYQTYTQSSHLEYRGLCSLDDPNGVLSFFVQTYIDNLTDEINLPIVSGTGTKISGWYCIDDSNGYIFVRRHICHMDPNIQGCDSRFSNELSNGTWGNEAGIIFPFKPMGLSSHDYGNGNEIIEGLTPGNDLYYLEKLSRFELLGIPQIYYEPIYCNDNRNNLVPGLFKTAQHKRSEFETISFQLGSVQNSYNGTAATDDASLYNISTAPRSVDSIRATNDKNVSLDKIFSSYEFFCCKRLGENVSNSAECCSGYGVRNGNQYTCKLPVSTNLNVYFNRFVSGEGSYYDLNSIQKLNDTDFDPQTGYPLLNESVVSKLISLGEEHCSTGKVFTGASFGEFGPRPIPNAWIDPGNFFPYGILYNVTDSYVGVSNDENDNNIEGFRGFIRFNDGRRWNHHIYCGSTQ